MNPPALFFKSIEIRRMPGFPKGDLDVEDLCPGVNIIYGPNASGKTTLGRAIHRLLRPTDPPHGNVSLRTTFELNGTPMSLDYDMGQVKCQKLADGADIDSPKLAPPEIGDRHVLALHDLVNSERDHDLAQDIARELAGGYDVAEASRALSHRPRASGKGKLSKQHQAAKQAYLKAWRQQDSLLGQQTTLEGLQTDKQAAREAQIRLGLLEKSLDYVAASGEFEEARNLVEAFPQGTGDITLHDVEELDRLNELLEKLESRRSEVQYDCDGARESLEESELPDEGVPVELVPWLRR
ncbi:MAG: AAA family ATPase, partial [Pirellulaceae bacterium]|nr:AAA family ATPase [Pirellulaceae bacterium]